MTAGCMEGLGTRRGSSLRIMFKLCVWFNSFGFCCVLYVTRREKKRMCVFLIAHHHLVSLQWHFIITQGIEFVGGKTT